MTDKTTGESTYEDECAARGAALLDEHSPGWRGSVRVTTLDMHDWCRCVLGQVFDTFGSGCARLGLSHAEASVIVELGFDIATDDESDYRLLREGWVRVLRDPTPRAGEVAHALPGAVLAATGER